MSQITSGVRAILSSPRIYNIFQNIMGAHKGRMDFSRQSIRAQTGDRVLDIGCGTAEILTYLPEVEYLGMDIHQPYIDAARSRFGNRGIFECQILSQQQLVDMPDFDITLAIGVLHHMDDDEATNLFSLAHAALCSGGRFITIDPCFEQSQSALARYLVGRDRGQHVRDKQGYQRLAESMFTNITALVKHRRWIPYTHCIMECTR